jgi:hypothetical protein
VFFGLVLVAIGLRPAATGLGLLDRRPLAPRATAIAGAALACGAAAILAAYYSVLALRFGGWGPSHFYVYSFANGPLALVLSPFTHPREFAGSIFTLGRLTYVLEGLIPLAFLPLLSWWAALAVPGAAVVLLANSGYVWRMGDHYAALWIPWLLVATIMGVVMQARKTGLRVANGWTTASAALCIIFLIAFDPLHPLHYLHPYYHDLADARRALACVPENASVATYDEWFSAVAAQRPRATIDLTNGVDYLVYADDFPGTAFQLRMRPAEVARGEYRAVCRFGDVTAYRAAGEN